MIYEVVHRTRYDYDAPVTASYAEVHQLPGDVDGQLCLRRDVTTEPAAEHQREHVDYFGNLVAVVVDPRAALHGSSSPARAWSTPPVGRPSSVPMADEPWDSYTAGQAAPDDLDVVEFALDSPLVTALGRSSPSTPDHRSRRDRSLADGVARPVRRGSTATSTFDPDATDVDTPARRGAGDRARASARTSPT